MKTRLIQYLHEELGFDVIAFESGMGNAAGAYARVGSRSPEELMKDTIFGVWWSKETLPLFDYIKQSAGTERPLIPSGFDMQVQFPYASFMTTTSAKKQFAGHELSVLRPKADGRAHA
ncbi:erythromycin esterase family protein [Paenibacillus ehimensis]|uniref:Erythromycin esterase family protein n=1 Tax=Paenibacillus ehimensis TaxID=79264 RepID=A0ABT8V2U4_9BACL|nr:erythromycin esterase family protein [Paenibacillus ehimensis]MDO3675729.1 erythromycin esterase family protein [Paenibacillus ehimensis]